MIHKVLLFKPLDPCQYGVDKAQSFPLSRTEQVAVIAPQNIQRSGELTAVSLFHLTGITLRR